MVSSSEVPRNAERAQRDGRAASWVTSAAKSIIEAGARKPRPDCLLVEGLPDKGLHGGAV
jgi:hypothetical protein